MTSALLGQKVESQAQQIADISRQRDEAQALVRSLQAELEKERATIRQMMLEDRQHAKKERESNADLVKQQLDRSWQAAAVSNQQVIASHTAHVASMDRQAQMGTMLLTHITTSKGSLEKGRLARKRMLPLLAPPQPGQGDKEYEEQTRKKLSVDLQSLAKKPEKEYTDAQRAITDAIRQAEAEAAEADKLVDEARKALAASDKAAGASPDSADAQTLQQYDQSRKATHLQLMHLQCELEVLGELRNPSSASSSSSSNSSSSAPRATAACVEID